MGFLLLLAAAWHTGLITVFLDALPLNHAGSWLRRLLRPTLLRLLLTLLFLCAVGLRRTWDLRTYTGGALALLTGRLQAYSYRMAERFLAELARSGADIPLTDALAQWTHQLWMAPSRGAKAPLAVLPPPDDVGADSLFGAAPSVSRPVLYIDSHRKPVYSEVLLPRGLIGRTGKVLGCRTLVLLHDAQGHVLLPLTRRGDAHLTTEAPALLERYAQASGQPLQAAVVIDREGMGAAFLFTMVLAGHTVITCLRADQYQNLESFTDVGPFIPLTTDADGQVVREVALARFALAVPQPEPVDLELQVALIRDWSWQVPVAASAEPVDWCADLDGEAALWWADDWVAPPAPVGATQPKLIPIVSTDRTLDAAELVQLYTARWPCQENVIKDWLIPLGIDVNHGYAKTAAPNSETAKQRAELEQRDQSLQQRATSARIRLQAAIARKIRLQTVRQAQLAAVLEKTAEADEEREIQQYDRLQRAAAAVEREHQKVEQYCRDQRTVRRALADLAAQERPMYELDNRKDQVMTVCKVALANLAMWVRDQYFPTYYAQASWNRLLPFFQLTGTMQWESDRIRVQVRPFNDRALRRDLQTLCTRVAEAPPRLPDGRHLVLEMLPPERSVLKHHWRC